MGLRWLQPMYFLLATEGTQCCESQRVTPFPSMQTSGIIKVWIPGYFLRVQPIFFLGITY